MRFWRSALAMTFLALLRAGPATAETPAAPAVAPQAPPATPPAATPPATPPAVTPPAAPVRGPAVVLPLPQPVPGVFGGKVEFADKAFPIVGDHKEADVQTAIHAAHAQPCRACRGTGRVTLQDSFLPLNAGLSEPLVQKWEQICPDCGGFKDAYGPKFGSRLMVMVDQLSHADRGEPFASHLQAAADCLKAVFDVRTHAYVTFKGVHRDRGGGIMSSTNPADRFRRSTRIVGLDVVPDQQVKYSVEVSSMVAAIWKTVRLQAPAGQPVLLVGTVRQSGAGGGWTFAMLDSEVLGKPQPQFTVAPAPAGASPTAKPQLPAPAAPGAAPGAAPAAPSSAGELLPVLVLCRPESGCGALAGRVAVGGLLVGKWAPPAGVPVPVVLGIVAAGPNGAIPGAQAAPAGPSQGTGVPPR